MFLSVLLVELLVEPALLPRSVGSSLIHGMMVRRAACKKAKKCGLDAAMFMWCLMIVRKSVALVRTRTFIL